MYYKVANFPDSKIFGKNSDVFHKNLYFGQKNLYEEILLSSTHSRAHICCNLEQKHKNWKSCNLPESCNWQVKNAHGNRKIFPHFINMAENNKGACIDRFSFQPNIFNTFT